jgi:c-di-GMP-binding flagellar brake protein YcgR
MYHLTKDASFKANIIDLSVHGALIVAEKLDRFNLSDQIKISIPAAQVLGISQGEFLKISARVRRVFIGGSTAGVSFEFVTEKQENQLTRILTSIAREDLVK